MKFVVELLDTKRKTTILKVKPKMLDSFLDTHIHDTAVKSIKVLRKVGANTYETIFSHEANHRVGFIQD